MCVPVKMNKYIVSIHPVNRKFALCEHMLIANMGRYSSGLVCLVWVKSTCDKSQKGTIMQSFDIV